MELSNGIETHDLFKVSNNMVSGDDSAKKGTQLSLTEESYINKESEKQLRTRYDQFISSKYVAVSRLKCKIYCWWWWERGGGGRNGVEILLVSFYRSKPEITTVLMGRLTRMQTLLCKIVIRLKIPHLQWRQSFCLNNKYINEKGNCLNLTHQHWQNLQLFLDSQFIFFLSSILQKFHYV